MFNFFKLFSGSHTIKGAKNNKWKRDHKLKDKSDGDGNEDQGEIDGIELNFF